MVWALGLGLAAAALGYPLAWWARRSARSACVWIVAPLLMPSYLAYAGWGLMRAPGTWLGDWLESVAEHGARWAPVVAGEVLAFVGLSLWTAPIAAIVTAIGLRSIDASLLDAVRLERGSVLGRAGAVLSISRGAVLAGFGVVTVLMLGSAVPLHLAQVRTLAVDLWLALDTTPPEQHWRAWVSVWPLVAAAAVTGWWVGGKAVGADAPNAVVDPSSALSWRGRWDVVAAVGVVVLGVLGPLALFVLTLQRAASLRVFWVINGRAVWESTRVALVVGAVGVLVMIGVAWRASRPGGGAGVRVVVRALVALGVVPGVLVGSLVTRTLGRAPVIGDSWGIVVVAHVLRFGFVPALLGCWAARSEPAAERALRILDGGGSFGGWARAALRPIAGPVLACGAGTGLLSLHEIESTVQVVPPGESLARQILQFLHFSRLEEMSAAGVWMVGGGLVLAGVVAALARPWFGRRNPGG